jgi:hypothetical protein
MLSGLSATEFRGIQLQTGLPAEPLVEQLGEPTSYFREDGCDCAGCRLEETFFYREGTSTVTIIARDGVVFSVNASHP